MRMSRDTYIRIKTMSPRQLWRDVKLAFALAYQSLVRNRLRTVLTIMGIVVGITAIMIVLAAGQAIKGYVIGQVNQFGTDYVQTEVKVPNTAHTSTENATGQAQGITITTLTLDDMTAIKRDPNVNDAYGAILGQETLTYRETNKTATLFGVSASFDAIDPGEVELGRFFDEGEDDSLARVIVLGSDLRDELFPNADPIGAYVRIRRQNYRIIGVMRRRGASGFFNMDTMAFLPVQTLQRQILGVHHISFIFSQVRDTAYSDVTVDNITQLLRDRHGITHPDKDDFAVTSAQQALDILGSVVGGIQILLFAIGAISLVVGGVGILNIMYVAVSERTFEIGIRKAVGAAYGDIMVQFLCESIFITGIGGVVGIGLGIALSYLAAHLASAQGFAWSYSISALYILIAAGVSVAVGMISGYYPAKRAAQLEPIVALRNEQ